MTFKMPKMGRPARAVSLSVLFLTGCASIQNKTPLTLPPSLFRCLPEPTPPRLSEAVNSGATKDSEIALFIKDLAYAGRDCRAQLSEVGHMLDLQPEIELTDVVVSKTLSQDKPKRWWRPF